MNVWKLTAAKNLVKFTEELRPEEEKIRVRVTKVFVNDEDGLLFQGTKKTKYPIVPGRFAVGLVADDKGGALFPKDSRVLLHYFLPEEDTGTEKKDFFEDACRVRGSTTDGFLRDFVYVGKDEMTPLPDAVNDEKALLVHHLALAKEAIDRLGVHKGEHIAVIGGNVLGIFICRLLIYQQASPILIDRRPRRLEFAQSRGIYYTSPDDASLMDYLGRITGGRLADGVIYVACAGENDVGLPVRVCSPGKNIVYCGQTSGSLPLDINETIKKRLTVSGVPDGTDFIENAINLIASKAIDVALFNVNSVGADGAPLLLRSLAEDPENSIGEIDILNLV